MKTKSEINEQIAHEYYMEWADRADELFPNCPQHVKNRVHEAAIEWLKLYRENHGDHPIMNQPSVTDAIEFERSGIVNP